MANVAERGALVALVLAVALAPRLAYAQSASVAEVLFEEGRRAMEAGDYPTACAKLAESERIDPAGGTLMNLAACHERMGKTATAWAEFNDALAQAKRDGRDDRVLEATKRIADISPRLARVTLTVAAARQGLEVRVDGTPLGAASWGTAIPVDPGDHQLRASAPGCVAWSERVSVVAGATTPIVVPPLALLPAPEPAGAASRDEPGPREPRLPVAALVVGGVGVVALGVGTYFGLAAAGKNGTATRSAPRSAAPSPAPRCFATRTPPPGARTSRSASARRRSSRPRTCFSRRRAGPIAARPSPSRPPSASSRSASAPTERGEASRRRRRAVRRPWRGGLPDPPRDRYEPAALGQRRRRRRRLHARRRERRRRDRRRSERRRRRDRWRRDRRRRARVRRRGALVRRLREATLDQQRWPNTSTIGAALGIDDVHTNGGSRGALHAHSNVVTVAGGGPVVAFLGVALPLPSHFFVRFFAYAQSPAAPAAAEILMNLQKDPGGMQLNVQASTLAFSSWANQPTLNVTSDTAFALDQWHCVEWEIIEASGLTNVWLDGQVVPKLSLSNVVTPPYDQVKLGLAFDNPPVQDAHDVWIDDFRMDTTRGGCAR